MRSFRQCNKVWTCKISHFSSFPATAPLFHSHRILHFSFRSDSPSSWCFCSVCLSSGTTIESIFDSLRCSCTRAQFYHRRHHRLWFFFDAVLRSINADLFIFAPWLHFNQFRFLNRNTDKIFLGKLEWSSREWFPSWVWPKKSFFQKSEKAIWFHVSHLPKASHISPFSVKSIYPQSLNGNIPDRCEKTLEKLRPFYSTASHLVFVVVHSSGFVLHHSGAEVALCFVVCLSLNSSRRENPDEVNINDGSRHKFQVQTLPLNSV